MSRSWSSAHDWKSCKGQKLFESSNLSISAKNNSLPSGRLLFFDAGWRDSNQYRTSQRDVHRPVRTLADSSVFPLGKNANGYSPSPPKITVCHSAGCCFLMRDGEIRINIEHPSGMFICQCEHWQILLFFLWKNANGYSPSPPEKSTCFRKCFFQGNPPFGWVKYPADVKSSLRSGDIAAA